MLTLLLDLNVFSRVSSLGVGYLVLFWLNRGVGAPLYYAPACVGSHIVCGAWCSVVAVWWGYSHITYVHACPCWLMAAVTQPKSNMADRYSHVATMAPS